MLSSAATKRIYILIILFSGVGKFESGYITVRSTDIWVFAESDPIHLGTNSNVLAIMATAFTSYVKGIDPAKGMPYFLVSA
jgi:hypothetical protein